MLRSTASGYSIAGMDVRQTGLQSMQTDARSMYVSGQLALVASLHSGGHLMQVACSCLASD